MASSARIDELRKKFDENPRRYFAPLANEYRKAGDLGQAIFICQEYLPQQPGHMSGHIVYGQALYEMGRAEEAQVVFETALSLDPENLIALRHLGDIARQANDTNAARIWYQRVLEADPRNEEIAQIMISLLAAPEPAAEPVVGNAPAAVSTTAPTPVSTAIVPSVPTFADAAAQTAPAAHATPATSAAAQAASVAPAASANPAPPPIPPTPAVPAPATPAAPAPFGPPPASFSIDGLGAPPPRASTPRFTPAFTPIFSPAVPAPPAPAEAQAPVADGSELLDLDDFNLGMPAQPAPTIAPPEAPLETPVAPPLHADPVAALETADEFELEPPPVPAAAMTDDKQPHEPGTFDLGHEDAPFEADPFAIAAVSPLSTVEVGAGLELENPDVRPSPQASVQEGVKADGLQTFEFQAVNAEPPEPIEPLVVASDSFFGTTPTAPESSDAPSAEPGHPPAEATRDGSLESLDGEAATNSHGPTPTYEAPSASESRTPEAFVTETMAELYLQQGHLDSALEIYDRLVMQRPTDAGLHERRRAVEERVYGKPPEPAAAESAPAPVYGGPTIREFLRGLVSGRSYAAQAAESEPSVDGVQHADNVDDARQTSNAQYAEHEAQVHASGPPATSHLFEQVQEVDDAGHSADVEHSSNGAYSPDAPYAAPEAADPPQVDYAEHAEDQRHAEDQEHAGYRHADDSPHSERPASLDQAHESAHADHADDTPASDPAKASAPAAHDAAADGTANANSSVAAEHEVPERAPADSGPSDSAAAYSASAHSAPTESATTHFPPAQSAPADSPPTSASPTDSAHEHSASQISDDVSVPRASDEAIRSSFEALFIGTDVSGTEGTDEPPHEEGTTSPEPLPPAPLHGLPAHRASSELSLDHVFKGNASPRVDNDGFSFDRFFNNDTAESAPKPQGEGRVPPTGTDDIAQFNAWLNGLKKT